MPLVPRVQKIKTINLTAKLFLLAFYFISILFVKKLVHLDVHYSERQGLMGFKQQVGENRLLCAVCVPANSCYLTLLGTGVCLLVFVKGKVRLKFIYFIRHKAFVLFVY